MLMSLINLLVEIDITLFHWLIFASLSSHWMKFLSLIFNGRILGHYRFHVWYLHLCHLIGWTWYIFRCEPTRCVTNIKQSNYYICDLTEALITYTRNITPRKLQLKTNYQKETKQSMQICQCLRNFIPLKK